MKKIIMALCVMLIANTAKADPRYVIVERVGQTVQWSQPSYETQEGRRVVESLRRVPAEKWNGCDFWNENSRGVAVRCGFRSDRSAVVLVDQNGEPLYLVGCRGGTFYNRIQLIRSREVCRPTPPEPQRVVRRQVVCEEEDVTFRTGATFGEYDRPHSMEFGYCRERFVPLPSRWVPRCGYSSGGVFRAVPGWNGRRH